MTLLRVTEFLRSFSRGIRSERNRNRIKKALVELMKGNSQPIFQLLRKSIVIHSPKIRLSSEIMTKALMLNLDFPFVNNSKKLAIPNLTIVVPIYGNLEALMDLIPELDCQTHPKLQILLIDDGSSDRQMDLFLAEIKTKPRFKVMQNDQNIGYTATINRAIIETNSDLILLNTDTRISQDFAERIHIKLRENPRYATVSPLSNAASICSIPEATNEYQIESITSDAMSKINELLQALKSKLEMQEVEIPTAVGFAMAIKREALIQVGIYNQEEFSPGYGEEVEWCLRASRNGWLHLLDSSIFVYHTSGSSFGESKSRLIDEHSKIIRERYPKFEPEVFSFLQNDPLLEYRWISYLYFRKYIGNPLTLVVRHQKGGGSGSWTLKSLQKSDCVELTFENNPIVLFNGENNSYRVELSIETIITLINKDIFDHVEIGSLPFNVMRTEIDFAKCLSVIINRLTSKIKVITVTHDYYFVCPSYTLIDYDSVFCDIPKIEICNACIQKNNYIEIVNRNFTITEWRAIFQTILNRSNRVVFLSKNSKNYFSKVFQINPEKIEYFNPFNLRVIDADASEIREEGNKSILILGNINYAKGAEVVLKLSLLPLFQNREVSLHLLGNYEDELPKSVAYHGTYESNNLKNLLKKINPDLVLIPSIWPETYCFTAEEAWNYGFRVAFFNIGALPERFLNRERAYQLSYPYSEKTSKELQNILQKSNNGE